MQLRIQGGHGPVPVKTSHKKDGRHWRPLIFHVSWPPPSDHAGSDTAMFETKMKRSRLY